MKNCIYRMPVNQAIDIWKANRHIPPDRPIHEVANKGHKFDMSDVIKEAHTEVKNSLRLPHPESIRVVLVSEAE